LSKIDIALVVITLMGAYKGYKDGFLMGLFTLLALVLGVFGAFKLMGDGMDFLQREFNADKTVLPYISFIVIFIAIVVLVTLLGKWLRNSIDKSFLGRVDEIMGAMLGAVKTLFGISVLLWIVDSLKYRLPDEWTEGSWLYPFTAHLAPEIAGWLAGFVPFFKEIFPVF
jgi:membrane protein required for colicin V production